MSQSAVDYFFFCQAFDMCTMPLHSLRARLASLILDLRFQALVSAMFSSSTGSLFDLSPLWIPIALPIPQVQFQTMCSSAPTGFLTTSSFTSSLMVFLILSARSPVPLFMNWLIRLHCIKTMFPTPGKSDSLIFAALISGWGTGVGVWHQHYCVCQKYNNKDPLKRGQFHDPFEVWCAPHDHHASTAQCDRLWRQEKSMRVW